PKNNPTSAPRAQQQWRHLCRALSLLVSHSSPKLHRLSTTAFSFARPDRTISCSNAGGGGQTGFFTWLGRLIKEKANSDVEKLFSGFSKTCDNLAVVDKLLLYWNLADTDRVLDELEEALLVSDFGPKITIKIVESLREDIDALKKSVLDLLTIKGKTELQLGYRKPAVVMIVGVNGGGKTTSLAICGLSDRGPIKIDNDLINFPHAGKLAYRLKNGGANVLMAAGDTFRAAACDQLEIWAERTVCEIVVAEREKAKAPSGLHTNYSLMEELIACKKAVTKVMPGAPNEILQILDGTTGLDMLPQAREFNEIVGITGMILTKLDGSARGGCVVSVVNELGIPVKFVGVGEGVEDLQPFDPEAFVNAIFSESECR
ncbi:hypothetical protein DVH24_014153, partial [Malus domestica]